jgi:hypothetical protein
MCSSLSFELLLKQTSEQKARYALHSASECGCHSFSTPKFGETTQCYSVGIFRDLETALVPLFGVAEQNFKSRVRVISGPLADDR